MILRIARHTSRLQEMARFYTEVLGLEIVGKFENHDSYDGIMLGHKDQDWHLEFTQNEKAARHTFDADDLLVFYPTSLDEYHKILERIQQLEIRQITPENPYWIENGIMIADPDRFKIVISPVRLNLEKRD